MPSNKEYQSVIPTDRPVKFNEIHGLVEKMCERVPYAQQFSDKMRTDYRDINGDSALALATQLRNAGINTHPYRVHFDYLFEPNVADKETLINDAWRLQFFMEWLRQKPEMAKSPAFNRAIDDAATLAGYYLLWFQQSMQFRNKFGARVHPFGKWTQKICFNQMTWVLLGIGYGINPIDIKYFATTHYVECLRLGADAAMESKEKFKDEMTRRGFDIGCVVMAPAHRDLLLRKTRGCK